MISSERNFLHKMIFNKLRIFGVIFACVFTLPGFAADRDYYIITLNKDGGTGGLDKIYVKGGNSYNPTGSFTDDDKIFVWDAKENKCKGKIEIPTKPGYTFEGYGVNQINSSGGGDLACQTIGGLSSDATWGASWKKCENGRVFKNNCNVPQTGFYLSEAGELKYCPGFNTGNNIFDPSTLEYIDGSYLSNLWQFTDDPDSTSLDIDRCAIKLGSESSCDSETSVIYVYNTKQNKYVRKSNYKVVAGLHSIIKEPSETDLVDYCELCSRDEYNIMEYKYNINNECKHCNAGYCVDDNKECVACPAGYNCPESGGNLSCSTVKAENSTYICPVNTYSDGGKTDCTSCGIGYTTGNSGPIVKDSEGNVSGDDLCLKVDENNMGYGCTSSRACQMVTPQLCHGSCSCDVSEEISKAAKGSDKDKEAAMTRLENCGVTGTNASCLLDVDAEVCSFKVKIGKYERNYFVYRSNYVTSFENNQKFVRCFCNTSFGLGDNVSTVKTYSDVVYRSPSASKKLTAGHNIDNGQVVNPKPR